MHGEGAGAGDQDVPPPTAYYYQANVHNYRLVAKDEGERLNNAPYKLEIHHIRSEEVIAETIAIIRLANSFSKYRI